MSNYSQSVPIESVQFRRLYQYQQWLCFHLYLSTTVNGSNLFNSQCLRSSTVSEWWNVCSDKYQYLHLCLSAELHRCQLSNVEFVSTEPVREQWHLHDAFRSIDLVRLHTRLLRRSMPVCQSLPISDLLPWCLSSQSSDTNRTMCLFCWMDRYSVRRVSSLYKQPLRVRHMRSIGDRRLHVQLHDWLLWCTMSISYRSIAMSE